MGFCVGVQDPVPGDCMVVVVDQSTGLDGALPSYGEDILEAHSESHALLGHNLLPYVFLLYCRCSGKVHINHFISFATSMSLKLENSRVQFLFGSIYFFPPVHEGG
jgi:hypothetical protein